MTSTKSLVDTGLIRTDLVINFKMKYLECS